MNYSIQIQHDTGETQSIALAVKSKREAMRGMRSFMNCGPVRGGNVYLAFFREGDGQRGYISPRGDCRVDGVRWN